MNIFVRYGQGFAAVMRNTKLLVQSLVSTVIFSIIVYVAFFEESPLRRLELSMPLEQFWIVYGLVFCILSIVFYMVMGRLVLHIRDVINEKAVKHSVHQAHLQNNMKKIVIMSVVLAIVVVLTYIGVEMLLGHRMLQTPVGAYYRDLIMVLLVWAAWTMSTLSLTLAEPTLSHCCMKGSYLTFFGLQFVHVIVLDILFFLGTNVYLSNSLMFKFAFNDYVVIAQWIIVAVPFMGALWYALTKLALDHACSLPKTTTKARSTRKA